MKSPLVVPTKATLQIQRFAESCSSSGIIFLERSAAEESDQANCYNNVRHKVGTEGGELVVGWAVRIWPRVLIEAEAHVVWRDKIGEMLDVTPHPRQERSTCFIVTEEKLFSEAGLALQPNRYFNVAIGKLRTRVAALIKSAQAKQSYELQNKSLIGVEPVLTGETVVYQALTDDLLRHFEIVKRKSK